MLQVNNQVPLIALTSSDALPHRLYILLSIIAWVSVYMIVFIAGSLFPVAADSFFSTIFIMLQFLLGPIMAMLVYLLLVERYRVRQLHFNADRLETLLKNLPGMAYRCFNRKYWPMEFVSEGCYALCGYDRRDLEEQRVLWGKFITHPDEIEFVERSILDAVGKDEPFEVEYRIITREGEEKWVWERGRAVGVLDGETILEGLITDITDRKLTEQALMRAEAYAKAVVDTAVEAVITIDEMGCIETVNRAAQTMFAYTPEAIKGENIRRLIAGDYLEEYNQYIMHYQEDRSSRVASAGCEVMGRRQDDSTFPIHFVINEVLNQPERKYVGLIRDLTLQREAEKEVREQREQLAHVDRLNTLGEMATVIAHEINQPLTAISMYAQSGLRFLDRDNPKPERLRDALEKLYVQAHRAGSVIERVQQLSRQHESHSEEVDCNALIRDVHKLAEVEAQIRDIVITLKLPRLLPMVVCDPVQIQQVVLNLLRNGMESMKKAGYNHGNRIVLHTSGTGAGVRISIIDSGSGISDETAEQLYRPFSTTKDTGMGMGLSISRSIVRAHGGQLEFTNNANAGVTFYFTLPYARSKKI